MVVRVSHTSIGSADVANCRYAPDHAMATARLHARLGLVRPMAVANVLNDTTGSPADLCASIHSTASRSHEPGGTITMCNRAP